MMKYIIILLLLLPTVYSQNYIKIKYFYTPEDMIVERGKSVESFVIIENTYEEPIYMISLKYEAPSGFSINSKELDELFPSQRKSIRFNLSANVNEGDYNITIWAEAIDEIDGNKIQSPKYTFKVKVFEGNTTQTVIETQTTETIIPTTTFYETTTILQSTTTPLVKQKLPNNIKFALIALLAIVLVILFIIMLR